MGNWPTMDEWVEQVGTAGYKYALKLLEDQFGLPFDKLKELVIAHSEGRCIVLPCKPSDVTVYELRSKKHALGVGVHPRHVGCTIVWSDKHYMLCHQGDSSLTEKNFNKQWFLDEEQAKQALRGESKQ